jgi:hypothetical protein
MSRIPRIVAVALVCAAGVSMAQDVTSQSANVEQPMYEVTITNITHGEAFTPVLMATHNSSYKLFQLGAPVGAELAILAQEGAVAPLQGVLDTNRNVAATVAAAGPTPPGQTLKLTITGKSGFDHLSLAAMLIPTNDSFMALNGIDLSSLSRGKSIVVQPVAYDAGAEINNERCDSLPSTPVFPECGGHGGGMVVGNGEGFVHVHNGIHGIGDLVPWVRTWQNPVANIEVKRVR